MRTFLIFFPLFIATTAIIACAKMQDEMLPPAQMRELYEIAKAAGAQDLTWEEFPGAHHMGMTPKAS